MREMTQAQIEAEIFSYLAEKPQAQDTLKGICEWWLLERQVLHRKAEVEKALDSLIEKGVLTQFKGHDNHFHYRLQAAV
jgi:hypothetical protein